MKTCWPGLFNIQTFFVFSLTKNVKSRNFTVITLLMSYSRSLVNHFNNGSTRSCNSETNESETTKTWILGWILKFTKLSWRVLLLLNRKVRLLISWKLVANVVEVKSKFVEKRRKKKRKSKVIKPNLISLIQCNNR